MLHVCSALKYALTKTEISCYEKNSLFGKRKILLFGLEKLFKRISNCKKLWISSNVFENRAGFLNNFIVTVKIDERCKIFFFCI
jgi:hypothetical protein